jgi:hypothetical protein
MDTIAPAMTASPAELRHRRVRLELGPGAAAHACGHVRAAITAWNVPVNQAVAILLTSDLVINAVTNGAGDTITLAIRWTGGQFKVEVYDAKSIKNSWETDDIDADRGLLLAAAMAADSGHYRTPAGRAVYYVLVPEQEQVSTTPQEGAASPPQGMDRGSLPRDAVSSGDGEL